jgi:hypothetical protein
MTRGGKRVVSSSSAGKARARAHARERRLALASRTAVVGVPGNTGYFGYQVTGEYLKTLDGQKGRKVFDEMYRSDPQVQATMKAITLPIRSCPFTIEPPADPEGKVDDLDAEIAEVMSERLFRGMSMTWDDTLRHALIMLRSGFSILEKVWEVSDGLVMPKKLDPRLPGSVIRWEFDRVSGSLVGPVQQDLDGKLITLPIEKLLVFTSEREGDNWEGMSVLRPAYKPWYIKDQLEKINAIKHDRHGVGVPRAKVPAGVKPGDESWEAVVAGLEALYANERSYVIDPDGYTTDLLGGGDSAAGTDALPSIKHYNEDIAKAALAMFINLGTSDTGSRALGLSFVELFQLSIQAYADYLAAVLDRFLIKEWWGYNWDTPAGPPCLKAGRIKPIDSAVLAQLSTAGVIKPDDELENAVRELMHLPQRKTPRPAPTPPPAPGAAPGAPDPAAAQDEPATDTPQDEPADAPPVEDVKASMRVHLSMATPTDEEKLTDWQGMGLRLASETADLSGQLQAMRDLQARDLIAQAMGGRKVQDMRVPMRKEMYDALVAAYRAEKKRGTNDVVTEIVRQRPDLKMADPRRKAKVTAAQFDAYSLDQLSLDVERQADTLRSAVATWFIDLRKSGLQGEQLRIAMQAMYDEMSTSGLDLLAGGAVDKGWGSGRMTGLEEVADEIQYCYRSAILDTNACEVCRAKDGTHHELGDPEYQTPDPECLGTDRRCRCMTIAVMKEEGAGA